MQNKFKSGTNLNIEDLEKLTSSSDSVDDKLATIKTVMAVDKPRFNAAINFLIAGSKKLSEKR